MNFFTFQTISYDGLSCSELNIIFNLLMQIQQLEKRLQDQFQVRHALENALGYKTSSRDSTTELSMPKVNSCHNDFMEIEIVSRACHCHSK